ncbi:MAG: hypothetical protein CVV02_14380 [Firmicutes bacterium HGW-Firmicutes-7]|nr:MAG: hypothetical protein CVV02_14380 [Firmicutes bacterium HGW-Firmicutes-7]
MSVFLLILKIILMIIIVILALAILLLSLVLFVPIFYSCKGEKGDEIVLAGHVSWLFGVINLNFSFEKEIAYSAKVLWKTIFSSQAEETTKKRTSSKSNKKSEVKKIDVVSKSSIPVKENDTEGIKDIENIMDIEDTEDTEVTENTEATEDAEDIKDIKDTKVHREEYVEKQRPFLKVEENKKANIKKRFMKKKADKKPKKKAKQKSSNIKESFYKIKDFLREDTYKGVIKFVMRHGWRMLKSILPRKIRINLKFGTDDPAVTGYILGAISIFYAVTGNSMVIEPDFEKRLLKGNFNLKGRIFIFILVYHALKIILDKRVKKLIAEYNH